MRDRPHYEAAWRGAPYAIAAPRVRDSASRTIFLRALARALSAAERVPNLPMTVDQRVKCWRAAYLGYRVWWDRVGHRPLISSPELTYTIRRDGLAVPL